jgi:hypothetical protein
MAELSNSGTYVKLPCHIWYDKRADNIHVTSNDKDLPPGNLHMTAKKGTQSDKNLRVLLDNYGCGPESAKVAATDPASELHKLLDDLVYGSARPVSEVLDSLVKARDLAEELLDEKE